MSLRIRRATVLTWLAGLVVALVPFLVLGRLFWGSPLWAIVGDSPQLYYPDLVMLSNAVREGVLPLWDPWERLGDPFFTDPQSGIFYPVNYLFIALGVVVGELSYSLYELKTVAHLSFAAVGMFAYLRSGLELRRVGAMAGAIVFVTGPFFVSHLAHCLLWPYAYAPWLLLFLLRLANARGALARRYVGGLALLTGLVITAQSPPAAYYVLVTASFYGLYLLSRILVRPRSAKDAPRVYDVNGALRFTGAAAAALILGFAMGLVVIVPSARHLDYSVLAERTFSYVSGGSIDANLWHALVVPARPHEEKWLYFGLLPIAGAVLAPFVARRHRGVALFWLGMAVFFITLCGSQYPSLKLWFTLAPGGDLFRIPARYVAVTQIGVAILCGLTVEGVVARIDTAAAGRRYHAWVRGLAAALFLALVASVVHDQAQHFGLYVLDKRRSSSLFLRDRLKDDLAPAALNARMINDGYLYVGSGDRFRLRDARGYNHNFVTRRHRRFIRNLRPGNHTNLLRLVGVLLYAQHPNNQRAAVLDAHKLPQMSKLKPRLLQQTGDIMPAAFVVDAYREVNTELEAERDVIARKDYRDYVLLERGHGLDLSGLTKQTLPKAWKPGDDGRAASSEGAPIAPGFRPGTLVSLTHHTATVEVESEAGGLLVYNALYYPGWVAVVDGVQQPVVAANYLQMATRIGPGKHQVTFVFDTTWLRWPAVLATLALLVAAGLIVTARRPRLPAADDATQTT